MLLTAFSTIGIPPVSAAPPSEPSQPIPSHGSSGVTVFVDLVWTCGETNLTYDIYFGTVIPPPLVAASQTTPIFEPDPLQLNTTYYWQIIAYNSLSESTQGPIWSFTTASNQPPFKPTILNGPPTAGPNILLEFETVAPDPEGDDVYYQWDWGDGTISDWFGPYNFGEQTKATHQWSQNGSYEIKVRAQDPLGKTSGWSSVQSITIEKQIEIENCKSGYLYFKIFTFDKTYGYIYSLDLLGMSLIISAGGLGMSVLATGADAVDTVIFEMKNRFLEEQRWNATSNNLTGNSFEGNFYLTDGLYETSAFAYDGEGRLIDKSVRQYVIFYEWKFVLIKQLLGLA